MRDPRSTVAGLRAQDCPGGGWNGMPSNLVRPTVADCLAHGVCGCIDGDAVKQIVRLQAALDVARTALLTIERKSEEGRAAVTAALGK